MANHTPEDNSVMQLSELMRGLEIPPASASLEPGQLYLIGEAIARQAKEVAAVTAQRDELLAALKYHQDQTRPIQRTLDVIARCEVQNG